jgi:hypothetical protein
MKPITTDIAIVLSIIESSTKNIPAHLNCRLKVLPSFLFFPTFISNWLFWHKTRISVSKNKCLPQQPINETKSIRDKSPGYAYMRLAFTRKTVIEVPFRKVLISFYLIKNVLFFILLFLHLLACVYIVWTTSHKPVI